ncbi:MAG TPA: hypothetical protein VHZ31_00950 [Solirubrobacteraceae bacterium]|nr:hypothetical protein [Solirubrobacteraceae bacterium]
MIDRFAQRAVSADTSASFATSHAVVIRLAGASDAPLLRELAALDSAPPLAGPALLAVVDEVPWAAHGLEDDRVIADPFRPSAEAVGLLALRVSQLRAAAQGRATAPRTLRRRLARRVRAS